MYILRTFFLFFIFIFTFSSASAELSSWYTDRIEQGLLKITDTSVSEYSGIEYTSIEPVDKYGIPRWTQTQAVNNVYNMIPSMDGLTTIGYHTAGPSEHFPKGFMEINLQDDYSAAIVRKEQGQFNLKQIDRAFVERDTIRIDKDKNMKTNCGSRCLRTYFKNHIQITPKYSANGNIQYVRVERLGAATLGGTGVFFHESIIYEEEASLNVFQYGIIDEDMTYRRRAIQSMIKHPPRHFAKAFGMQNYIQHSDPNENGQIYKLLPKAFFAFSPFKFASSKRDKQGNLVEEFTTTSGSRMKIIIENQKRDIPLMDQTEALSFVEKHRETYKNLKHTSEFHFWKPYDIIAVSGWTSNFYKGKKKQKNKNNNIFMEAAVFDSSQSMYIVLESSSEGLLDKEEEMIPLLAEEGKLNLFLMSLAVYYGLESGNEIWHHYSAGVIEGQLSSTTRF